MPRRSTQTTAEPNLGTTDRPLEKAVDRLAEEVRILRQAIDELRSEYEWALRQQRSAATLVRTMALDPLAPDWDKRLQVEQFEQPVPTAGIRDDGPWHDLTTRLEDTIEAVAEGQLAVILEFLGGVRLQLLEAIAGKHGTARESTQNRDSDLVNAGVEQNDAGAVNEQGSLF